MLFDKRGMPKEGDIVFCTVTKVQYHSVFATLDEFKGKHGMIHISEVSPGRIRNIGDYVKEGKVIICKVLRINQERGHIDLSLRRVNESQRRAKVEERKQQAVAENILKSYVDQYKGDLTKFYEEVWAKLSDSYETLYGAFEDVVENEESLASSGLDKDVAEKLEVIIRERIKPKQVEIIGTLKLESYDENGVDIINAIMAKVVKVSELLQVQFLGSGAFKIEIKAPDYTDAEAALAKMQETVEEGVKGSETTFTFERT